MAESLTPLPTPMEQHTTMIPSSVPSSGLLQSTGMPECPPHTHTPAAKIVYNQTCAPHTCAIQGRSIVHKLQASSDISEMDFYSTGLSPPH